MKKLIFPVLFLFLAMPTIAQKKVTLKKKK